MFKIRLTYYQDQDEKLRKTIQDLQNQNQTVITERDNYLAELNDLDHQIQDIGDLLAHKNTQLNQVINEKSSLLTNYQQTQSQKLSYENYLQMGLKVNHLNNLPINNSGQSLQQLITYYNSHNPRARLISLKTQTKEVIAQYRDDQGIDNSQLNTQLITDYAITQTN